MVVGSFAAGGLVQSDITRYAKSVKDSWIATALGFLGGNVLVISSGMYMVTATGADNLPLSMVGIGLGALGLVILIIAQWTTNDNNLYSSSLGLMQLIPNIKKSVLTAIMGIGATIIGAIGFYNLFVPFLIVLGNAFPPIAGVMIADYYVLKKQKYSFGPGTKYVSWNLNAFISIILGTIVAFSIHIGVSSVNGMVAAFFIYILINMAVGQKLNYGESIESETGF